MENTRQLVHELISVSRMHHRCIENTVRGMQIHHSGHRLLMHLVAGEVTPSQKELAERFDVSPAAVANNLKKLEKDGYIQRSTDEGDTRFNRIAITEKGKAICTETRRHFDGVDEAMLNGFSDGERAQLFSYLSRMKHNLAEICGEESPFSRKENDQ